ncbi:MAG: hypothetical protein ACRC30_02310 [Clostridium sp.]
MNDIKEFRIFLEGLYQFYNGDTDIRKLYLRLQCARDNFKVFNECCTLISFIEKLTRIRGKEFNLNNTLGTLSSELMELTILDEKYNIRSEWIKYIYNIKDESISKKRFNALIKLCAEIKEKEGADFALRCYTFFRMDIMIRRPVITMAEFRDALSTVLKSKINDYENKFIELFKEIYKIGERFGGGYEEYIIGERCTNCNYFFSDNDPHIWCVDAKRINESEKNYNRCYIIKPNAYKDYTRPGLIERDVFDKLKQNGFEVSLYPEMEKKGDLLINIEGEKVYIDCKTTENTEKLWVEVQNIKYKERIIVVQELYYENHKEYFKVKNKETQNNIKIYDLADLIKYLKTKRSKSNV